MRPASRKLLTVFAVAAVVALLLLPALFKVVTVTEGAAPPQPSDPVFPGVPAPSQPPPFAPERADPRRPDGPETNSSAAAVRLDIRPIQPEGEAHLDKIYPTYQLAVDFGGKEAVPSASLLASKYRQFDGALSAAVTAAAFEGVKGKLPGALNVLKRLAAKLPADSTAADCIGLALELAKCREEADLPKLQEATRGAERRARLLQAFVADRAASKPVWFFTWSKQLYGLWYCRSLLDRELAGESGPAVARALSAALRGDPALLADYRKSVDLLRLMAGPRSGLSLDEVPSGDFTADNLRAEAVKRGRQPGIAFLPLSVPVELALMERADLADGKTDFRSLVAFVRDGGVATPPDPTGLLDRRTWALGALMVPANGQERGRLSCTPRYAMRMLESFKAAPLRHRELRWRFGGEAEPSGGAAGLAVAPPLRVEPAPEFYRRTAQAYSAVGPQLKAVLGNALADMYGLRETWIYGQQPKRSVDERDDDLATELEFMKRLSWGLYLVSCEDLGLAADLSGPERPDPAACRQAALNWIASFRRDPDLKPDARFCTALTGRGGRSAHWAVVGVRLARLEATYAWPPSLRDSGAQWRPARPEEMAASDRLIPVDGTAFFELEGPPLTRCEFWDLLAAAETRDGVLEMVRQAGSREQLLKAIAKKLEAQEQPAAP